jgi:hypothetical protein
VGSLVTKSSIGRVLLILVGTLSASLAGDRLLAAPKLSERAVHQIQAILADKVARAPSERKLATGLLMAFRRSRGRAMIQGLHPFSRPAARAHVDEKGMVVVDVNAVVTGDLLRTIADVGGKVISFHPSYGAVRARVPIQRLDAVAALPEVRFIRPRARYVQNIGSQTSEGDVAHAVASTRANLSIDGTGVRVGVLSGWVAHLADRQASGDVPPTCADPPGPDACVTVVPCPACSPDALLSDEGTDMLEVIHDLVPGAQLFFASADGGIADFASNIQMLRNTYNCGVIVDDITYFDEPAFQDGPIAQAVNAVTNSGAVYFSSAGNGWSLSAGSGTWEGDFVDSGAAIPPGLVDFGYPPRPVHSFNGLTGVSAATSDPLTAEAFDAITLQWSDPWGAATTDYDLFLLSSDLSEVHDWSYDDQECAGGGSCSPDPFEIMDGLIPAGVFGERIVVVKWSGPVRALRVDTNGGALSIATAGAVYGHNAAERAVTVAAVDVGTAGGGVFTGGAANPVEPYSSDGPRRIFYNPNGTAITPGNVLFGTNGGRVLQKPDVTAADCVTIADTAFSPFCGTSAAAAHAAAIAALLKSAPNNPSGGQAVAAMFATALDVDPPGRDIDSGVGIVMADGAATLLTTIPAADFYTLTPCRVFDTRQPGGPTGGAPLACGADYDFTITGGACGVPASAKAVSLNVTVTDPTAQGNLRLFPSGAPAPAVSALNYVVGVTRANNAVAPLSASGKMGVRCAPSGTTQVIVDVNGYFE